MRAWSEPTQTAKNGHDNSDRPPPCSTPAVHDYLATLDDAAFCAATPVDATARWISAHGDRPHFAYRTNYLINLDHAVIVGVEATTDAYLVSDRQRNKAEMLFAHLKLILKLDRLRLRDPSGS